MQKSIHNIIMVAIFVVFPFFLNGQSLGQKKDTSRNQVAGKEITIENQKRLRGGHNEMGNSQEVPTIGRIETTIRWYAIENEHNPKYWESVNTSRAWLALEPGRSINENQIAEFLQFFGLQTIIRESPDKSKSNYWIFENEHVSPAQFVNMARVASEIEGILFLEPSVIYKQSYVPNDPLWENQWGPYASYFDLAWDYGTGGNSENVVAVIDDACDWNHEDLYDQVWYGYDYVYGSFDITPHSAAQDHGTHVTGTMAATIGNGIGVAGMVNDTVYFAKTGDDQNQLVDQAIVDAIYDIAQIPRVSVINMSLGADVPSVAMEDACNFAWNNGKLLIVASGNNGQGFIGFPAAYLSCVAVGSVGADGENIYLTNYSQFGPEQELCAAGGDEQAGFSIISTLPGNEYGEKDGTSMASPHVAGLAGLLKNLNPDLDNLELRNILAATAFDMGEEGWDMFHGYGLINAIGAVEAALGITSVGELDLESILTLYPNPTESRLTLQLNQNLSQMQLDILDISGKQVRTISEQNQKFTSVDVSDLTAGVYLLRLQSAEGVGVTKFVKR